MGGRHEYSFVDHRPVQVGYIFIKRKQKSFVYHKNNLLKFKCHNVPKESKESFASSTLQQFYIKGSSDPDGQHRPADIAFTVGSREDRDLSLLTPETQPGLQMLLLN